MILLPGQDAGTEQWCHISPSLATSRWATNRTLVAGSIRILQRGPGYGRAVLRRKRPSSAILARYAATITAIVESARRLSEMDGVTGLDLLAYRFNGNVEALMTSVVRAVKVPMIVAGSIDRPVRIRALAAAGIWGFTVGGTALDRRFAPDEKDLAMQIQAIVTARDDAG